MIVGSFVFTGTACLTTAVGSEVAGVAWAARVARRLFDADRVADVAGDRACRLCVVAPEIGAQLLPELSHCCHLYVKPVGLLVHSPLCSVSSLPCWAVPVMVGSLVFVGTPPTTVVGSEVAGLPAPPSLLAVSTTLIVWPTSPATGTYSWVVAPAIVVQPVPELLHCCHL